MGSTKPDKTLLSPKEAEIQELRDLGLSYREIAARLGIAYGTVHKHLRSIHERETGAKRGKGFESMAAEKRREVASKGGKRAHELGKAHEWTSEEAKVVGGKGGSISKRGPRVLNSKETTT